MAYWADPVSQFTYCKKNRRLAYHYHFSLKLYINTDKYFVKIIFQQIGELIRKMVHFYLLIFTASVDLSPVDSH